jgi:hypothetical protein
MVPLLLLFLSALLSSRLLPDPWSARTADAKPAGEAGLLLEISRRPALAFGFRNFLGDLAWLKAVQVAGARKMTPGDYDRLYVLLKGVGNFDPRFDVPYLLGGIILGDSPRHVPEALDILDRGTKSHPSDWRFPFYVGYTRYFSLGDPLEGGKALEEASRLPGSPPYLALLASRMLTEGREPKTALALLEAMAGQETDTARKEVLQRRIREVIVERDLQSLERAVEEYRARHGALPASLSSLAAAGILHGIPREPNGGRYLLSPGGEVRSDRMKQRLKVFRKR